MRLTIFTQCEPTVAPGEVLAQCACRGYTGDNRPFCVIHPARVYKMMTEEWWLPVMTLEETDTLDY